MADMLEGVEDICASLGLGHIPLLNEENRELNRKLQELQVRVDKKNVYSLLVWNVCNVSQKHDLLNDFHTWLPNLQVTFNVMEN